VKDRFRTRIEEARRIADRFIPLSPFPPAGGAEGEKKKEGEQRMLELNKLYNMDCMQGMKEFPDGFFDLAIVDPPYGIGIDGQKKRVCGNPKHNRKEHIRKSWDKCKYCGGGLKALGYAKKTEGSRNAGE
jgi:DNA modification methylase